MLKKLLFMVVFVAVLATVVTPAIAAIPKTDYTYDQESWWSGFGSDEPHMWDNTDNWWSGGNPIPESDDFASIGDPDGKCTIDSSIAAVCKVLVVGDWRSDSVLTITGGSLTIGTDFILGNRIWAEEICDGTLEMTGGTVELGDDLIISVDAPGDVNVGDGASINIGDNIIIGTLGHMLISGTGLVTLDEDRVFEVNGYIGAGKIYAPAAYDITCDYNTTIAGKTAVYAQPAVPATLTIGVEPNDIGIDSITPTIGEHIYYQGCPIILSAGDFNECPDVWRFDHWQGNVAEPNLSTTMITMSQDEAVTAVFLADERTCGDECHPIQQGDLNGDCRINLIDFAIYCEQWLSCTHPDCDPE